MEIRADSMPVSLLQISRPKRSEQFWELKMSERNTVSEPAVDTQSMTQLGNVSRPTDPTHIKHYFFSLSSFVLPNFRSYFLFLSRYVCLPVSFPSPVYLSLRFSYFILPSCFLPFFNSPSPGSICYYFVSPSVFPCPCFQLSPSPS